jgi:hypothetical protein
MFEYTKRLTECFRRNYREELSKKNIAVECCGLKGK